MRKLHSLIAFLVAAVMISCGGNAKVTPSDEQSGAPGAPTGLKLHGDPGETTLTFQWTAVEGAKGYNWKIAKGTSEVNSGKTSSRNVTVEGLEKGTAYKFSVQAMADGKVSAWVSVEATTAGESSDTPDGPDGPEVNPDPEAYAKFLVPSVEEDGKARAFPGAEGGGMWATGGRGGKVYHVTSLGDSASEEGTLRYGIEKADRPLTIVFDVAGTIALNNLLNIKKGDLTIAGQTAPGDGICLKNYTFRISASNVIVRFIRCRMGDEKKTEDDAMQVLNRDTPYENIIIDHCSISWCTDECASFYGMKGFTFSWNFVTESLRNSVHEKGAHGYGGIWGGENASYHHNLLAHHDSRNPRIDHDYVSTQKGPVSIFNNVVYNWSGNTCYGGESSSKNGADYRKYNFFNNYYKPGPATPSNHIWLLQPTTSCSNCGGTIIPGHFYMDGNVMHGKSDITSDNWKADKKTGVGVYISASDVSKIKETSPYSGDCEQSVHSAQNVFDAVLDYAGASFRRDAIDTRVATETRNGSYTYNGSNGSTKGLIDTQTDVADATWVDGWPVYAATEEEKDALRDSDSDGLPNWFEEEFGLNKSGASDAQAFSLDPQKRYTNLEMYLHYIVKDIVKGGNENSEYKKL
ncbi:MAG: fibronectin type III domain-containing protein [Bacteroidales bacterium]|nr:fibronectin type III domain-containing protein [Bacteroidales bacterium]